MGEIRTGEILKLLRAEKNFSQKQLAEMLNVAQNTVSNWENGTREPDNSTLLELSVIFDCSVDYLLGKTDERNHDITMDDETAEILETLHKRPEMKALFSTTKKATKDDVEKAMKIIEALKDK